MSGKGSNFGSEASACLLLLVDAPLSLPKFADAELLLQQDVLQGDVPREVGLRQRIGGVQNGEGALRKDSQIKTKRSTRQSVIHAPPPGGWPRPFAAAGAPCGPCTAGPPSPS